MKKLLAIVIFAAVISCGVESCCLTEKDYENIDRMLEFGAQIFLNYLDKVREVTERIVRENQLRNNRIAVQGYWNSFKETAKKISVEERSKGVQDDLLIVVRTSRRLVSHYKGDVQNMVHVLATEKSVQQYIPAIDMFEGIIQREKLNEVWGAIETYYFPEAPSLHDSPLEFICYLLSTTNIETFLLNVLKTGVDVISRIRRTNFQVARKMQSTWNEISIKASEFESLERKEGNDEDFILPVSIAARVYLFYWGKFLEYTETPEYTQKVEELAEIMLRPREFVILEEDSMLHSLNDLFSDIVRWHSEYYNDIIRAFLEGTINFVIYMTKGREFKSFWAILKVIVVATGHTVQTLDEMMFPVIKRGLSRASDIAFVFKEDFETFTRLISVHWESFQENAERVLKEKQRNSSGFPFPGLLATAQLWSDYSNQLISTIGGNIDDEEAERFLKNLEKKRAICTSKLLASGVVRQEELEESQRIFEKQILQLLERLHLKDANEIHDSLWSSYKVTLAILNYIYSPLTHTWNFITV